MLFPLPHQGHIQPPRSVLHTKAKGHGSRQCLGCKTARRRARSANGISSSWVGKTLRHGAPVAEVCALLAKTNWRHWSSKNCLGEHDGHQKLLGKPCCWPLLQWWQCSETSPSITAPSQCYSEVLVIPFPLMTRVYKVFPLVASLWDAWELLPFPCTH